MRAGQNLVARLENASGGSITCCDQIETRAKRSATLTIPVDAALSVFQDIAGLAFERFANRFQR